MTEQLKKKKKTNKEVEDLFPSLVVGASVQFGGASLTEPSPEDPWPPGYRGPNSFLFPAWCPPPTISCGCSASRACVTPPEAAEWPRSNAGEMGMESECP